MKLVEIAKGVSVNPEHVTRVKIDRYPVTDPYGEIGILEHVVVWQVDGQSDRSDFSYEDTVYLLNEGEKWLTPRKQSIKLLTQEKE